MKTHVVLVTILVLVLCVVLVKKETFSEFVPSIDG